MGVILTWNGEKVVKKVEQQVRENTKVAGRFIKKQIRDSINLPYPPASFPGEPPNKRSGELQRSISVRTDGNGIDINVGVDYAAALEFGTVNMEPRPFVGPVVKDFKKQIGKLLSKKK